MTDVVVVPALARLVAVLAPVALGAELLAPRARVAGPALAPAVHRVARGVVVAVTLVGAVGPERPNGTRDAAVLPHPSPGTAALPVHVVTLSAVLAAAFAEATPPVGALGTGRGAEESGVAWFAFALTCEKVAGSVA